MMAIQLPTHLESLRNSLTAEVKLYSQISRRVTHLKKVIQDKKQGYAEAKLSKDEAAMCAINSELACLKKLHTNRKTLASKKVAVIIFMTKELEKALERLGITEDTRYIDI